MCGTSCAALTENMENQTISFIIPAYIIIRALAQAYPDKKLSISYAPPGCCGAGWYCKTPEEANGIADYFQRDWERKGSRRQDATLYILRKEKDGFLVDLRDHSMMICPKEDFPEYDGQNKILIQDEAIYQILNQWMVRDLDPVRICGGYTRRNRYTANTKSEEKE